MAPKIDPEVLAHLEWLGFVQPTGLVVSAPALVRAGAILPSRDAEGQRLLRACVEERTVDGGADPEPIVADFKLLASKVLGWSFSPRGYAGTDEVPIPPELEVTLPDYGETLAPDFAVRERDPADGASPWHAWSWTRTLTGSSRAPEASRHHPTGGWSACYARRACRPACSPTAAFSG